jgi:prolipoprotein diacylglyceryltransferase
MKNYIIISPEGSYFSILYNIAFFVALLIVLIEGYKRNFPMLKWIVLVLFSRIFFIVGTKIITWTTADWIYFINTFNLPATENKALIGGLILGLIALVAGKYLLKFRENIFDAFALALPVAVAIQRAGCFLTGCCYGAHSSLPWAVKYPANTLPHYDHFKSGMLSYADHYSLPVHPVQLYEVVGLLLVSIIILRYRNRFRAKGSLMIFSFILLFFVRFLTEFFRAPLAHTIGGEIIGFMNTTQWVLFPVIITLGLILYAREKENVKKFINESPITYELRLTAAFISIFSVTIIFNVLSDWFTYAEMFAMAFLIMVATVILTAKFLHKFYHSPKRWLYLAGIFLPLILMSQAVPENGQDSLFDKSYKTIMLGFGTGQFENSQTYTTGSGCDRISNTEYFEQKYTLAAVGFSSTRIEPRFDESTTWGISAIYGDHTETRLTSTSLGSNSRELLGVNGYGNYDKRWLGFGAGLHLGLLSYITENYIHERSGIPNSASKRVLVYPQFYFRLGPQDIFYLDYRLANHFPSALPGLRHQFGVGTGLGRRNGTYLRFGYTGLNKYFAANLPIQNTFIIQPFFAWGSDPVYLQKKQFQFSIGLGYRFDHRIP